MIRLPVHVVERVDRLLQAERDLQQSKDVVSVADLANAASVDRSDAQQLLDWNRPVDSLDRPVVVDSSWLRAEWDGERFVVPLSEVLREDTEPDFVEYVTWSQLRENVQQVLDMLPSRREARIIALRFGLTGAAPMTLDEVGSEFGVTRERIRQVQNKALERLSHPTIRSRLLDTAYDPPKPAAPDGEFLGLAPEEGPDAVERSPNEISGVMQRRTGRPVRAAGTRSGLPTNGGFL